MCIIYETIPEKGEFVIYKARQRSMIDKTLSSSQLAFTMQSDIPDLNCNATLVLLSNPIHLPIVSV